MGAAGSPHVLPRISAWMLVGTALMTSGTGTAFAQTALPEIVVRSPSPIIRREPPAPPSAPAPVAPAPAVQAPPPAAPLIAEVPPGTLPIVTNQFATVTVVPNEEIRRTGGGTLGDLLFDKPGITGSSFGPGTSSRPIVRGLDVNRVGIVENGIGGGGISDLGEDHPVPIDPLITDQVEVIRGPATLRYGSQSIGGVVSATNNRIPEALPCGLSPLQTFATFTKAPPAPSASPQPCARFESRGAMTSVDRGVEGAVLLDAGGGNFAIHADAYGRNQNDYRIPKYPYLFPPDPAAAPRATQPSGFNGKQPNSGAHADGVSIGGSYIFQDGFVGFAVIQNNSLNRIPGIDGEDHNVRGDNRETKVISKGEYRPGSFVDVIRFWTGYTDYKRYELGLADDRDLGSDGVRQIFTSQEVEGRVEATLMPFDLRFATLTTAIGAQASHQDLTGPSPDDPGSPLNGLFSPNRNTRFAGYMFNEFKFNEVTKGQIAGRVEHVTLNGTVPGFIPDVFDITDDPTAIGPASQRNLQFTPVSVSVGLIHNLPWGLVGSVTAQRVERAPKAAELFSRGPHDATGTFDIGNPDLKIETAKSLEVGLRRAAGPFRFEATAYYTRFEGFIFRSLTGNTCDADACVAADDPNPLELKQARYSQRDATFRGGEFQSQYDVGPLWNGIWGIEDRFDIVRATFTDGTNVPRIPPVRLGGGVFWRDANWLVRVNLLHAFAHTDVEITPTFTETPTPGYNLLKAEVSYRMKPAPAPNAPNEVIVGVVGTNLLNDDIRNSVSYTKDEVLMPGRGFRFFANVKY